MTRPRRIVLFTSLTLAAALAALAGCGDRSALDAAHALEADGDPFGALSAFEVILAETPEGKQGVEATDAAQTLRDRIAADALGRAPELFELPEECTADRVAAATPAAAGVKVELALTCDGRAVFTGGRLISADKVWDLTPITGTLQAEGECVFRSIGNPLGDWAVAVAADECERQRGIRQRALDRIAGPEAQAAFECDCRVGEATFEVPRGEPMWQTGPAPVYTEDLPPYLRKQLEERGAGPGGVILE